jgi:hypothetical protein
MSLSKWQKLNARMTEKVVVPMACVAARDVTAVAACGAAEVSDLSLTGTG